MKYSAAMLAVLFSFPLGGCPWVKEKPETRIVPKVVEAPKSFGPDECLSYHGTFVELKAPPGESILPPSAFLDNWKEARKQYVSLNKDHSVCRAWHIKRRTLLSKEPAPKKSKRSS